jgi:hypothetical protein
MENEPTPEELQKQIQALLTQIQQLSRIDHQGISPVDLYEKENNRIERYLSELTQKEGVLLTIAGLFSLFPLFISPENYSYFLLWVIPFLLITVISYSLSSKRINIISKDSEELEVDYPRSKIINQTLRELYFSVIKFHRITEISFTSFFVSFVLNYYYLFFVGHMDIEVSVKILIISIVLSIFKYFYVSKIKELRKAKERNFIIVPTTPSSPTIPSIDNKEKEEN